MTDSRGDVVSAPERELKFRVHGLFVVPDLVGADVGVGRVRDGGVRDLVTTYYDTGDLRLARERITLRRREGGPDAGWHVKLPPDGEGVREELQLPLDAGAPGEPPAHLLHLLLARTRGAPVEPVATLHTERAVRLLDDPDGAPLAELVDDAVSVLDGDTVIARFRELELESTGADSEALGRIAEELQRAGAVEGGLVSKASRALGPAATAPSDVPAAQPVGPKDPAGEVVRAHLARHVRRFVDEDLRVRRDQPDSVHQMRVAARRLRSGLKVFGPLVEAEWSRQLRDELGWVAGVLGGVRDREVLEERLLDAVAELAKDHAGLPASAVAGAEKAIRTDLESGMAQARADVLAALDSPRYVALLDALMAAVHEPQLTERAAEPARRALPPLVRKAWRRLERDADLLGETTPDAVWHETRIAAKRARYATEAVVPVFGERAKALAVQAEQVTELLGEHQDTSVSRETLQRIAGKRGVGGGAGFALGLVHEREREHAAALRHRFLTDVWPVVARARRRDEKAGGFASRR